jgi:hypothetical protein
MKDNYLLYGRLAKVNQFRTKQETKVIFAVSDVPDNPNVNFSAGNRLFVRNFLSPFG